MGLFSRKNKSKGKLHMRGFPGHLDTCKCLYLAAEKGVQIDSDLLDMISKEHKQEAYLGLSPFGKIPCLGDGDMVIAGAAAILPYLDIKGAGQSLTPKKAVRLGEQNYWVEVGQYRLMPQINTLLDEEVIARMSDPAYTPDGDKIRAAINDIDQVFGIADKHLSNKKYFAGEFSFAEIHWLPYLHFCNVTGHADLVSKHANLAEWFERLKARKTGAISSYSVLPELEQIKGKAFRVAA